MSETTEPKRDADADMAVCNAAKPGPWTAVPKPKGTFGKDWREIHGPGRNDWIVMPGSFDVSRGDVSWTECGVMIKPEDADFIALARTALPHWIERALRAEAAIERWRDPNS
jgi:hypothetical protein